MEKLTLNEVKKILLQMLVDFDAFCDKHKLRYYLCGGALIGAIRHSGFIPWDDDIDVLMPRPDYERLINLEKSATIASDLSLFTYRKQNSNLVFIKLGNISTYIYNKYQVENECISIDIFPLDGASDNTSLNISRYRKMAFYHTIYSLQIWRPGNASKRYINICKTLAYPLAKLISHRSICEKMERLAMKIDYDEADKVGDIIWGYGINEIVVKKEFLPQIEVDFENYCFKTTVAYDKYLHQIYGDYMKLPPTEKRVNHELDAYQKELRR